MRCIDYLLRCAIFLDECHRSWWWSVHLWADGGRRTSEPQWDVTRRNDCNSCWRRLNSCPDVKRKHWAGRQCGSEHLVSIYLVADCTLNGVHTVATNRVPAPEDLKKFKAFQGLSFNNSRPSSSRSYNPTGTWEKTHRFEAVDHWQKTWCLCSCTRSFQTLLWHSLPSVSQLHYIELLSCGHFWHHRTVVNCSLRLAHFAM